MKLELLVIVDQRATVNAFPGLVHTARHTMGVGSTLRQSLKRRDSKTAVIRSHTFLRKEVIQPQVPLRLPCYDFTPVADLTVAGSLQKG